MGALVVVDAEFAKAAQTISNAAKELEVYAGYLASFVSQLYSSGAIESSATTKALSDDASAIKGMAGNITSSVATLVSETNSFIWDIDAIDTYAQ